MSEKQEVVTERTAKKWKAIQLIGGIAMFFGFALIGGGLALGPGLGVVLFISGIIVTVIGIVIASTGSLLAWWHHG